MAITKFFGSNAQSDGVKTLKRMEFEFDGKFYVFNINPEEYTQTEPSRIVVTQTKGGAWMDDWGSGIAKIIIKGTTGFKSKSMTQNQVDFLNSNLAKGGGSAIWAKSEFEKAMIGFTKFKSLRDTVREYYDKYPPGTVINSLKELILHNYTDGEHWVVAPETFDLFRSTSRPLLYSYNISLICLRPVINSASTADKGTVGRVSGLASTAGEDL